MWLVGACGLRGCMTTDTPMARNSRPASCGLRAVADGGSCDPLTSESATPALSKTRPPSCTAVMPWPCNFPLPAGRSHLSRTKVQQYGTNQGRGRNNHSPAARRRSTPFARRRLGRGDRGLPLRANRSRLVHPGRRHGETATAPATSSSGTRVSTACPPAALLGPAAGPVSRSAWLRRRSRRISRRADRHPQLP